MEKIEKNMKVKREKYLSESAINEVLNDFKDVREFVKSEGKPITCMCIMSSAGLCGNASAMDYMSMIATSLVHLIKGNIIDVFLNTHEECMSWGRRQVTVQILEYP